MGCRDNPLPRSHRGELHILLEDDVGETMDRRGRTRGDGSNVRTDALLRGFPGGNEKKISRSMGRDRVAKRGAQRIPGLVQGGTLGATNSNVRMGQVVWRRGKIGPLPVWRRLQRPPLALR